MKEEIERRKKKEADKKNVHEGHRERLRTQAATRGLRGMPDHQVLELLLFNAIPRRDTNAVAHALIDRFGSLARVLDAEIDDLTQVKGVGKCTARYLTLFRQVDERYVFEKVKKSGKLSTPEEQCGYLARYFLNKTDEEFLSLFLDNGGKVIGQETICRGTVNMTCINPRFLAERIFRHKASAVVLAHNHPAGDAQPSDEDISLTHHLMNCLLPFGVSIRAHYVVAKDRCVDILPLLYEKMCAQKPCYIAVKSPVPDAWGDKEE